MLGETQPKTIIAPQGDVFSKYIASTEDCLKAVVGAKRCVIVFKQIVVAGCQFKLGCHASQEEAVTAQPGEVVHELVVR